MESLKERLTDYIDGLRDADLVMLHNAYSEAVGYNDDRIFDNDEDTINGFFSTPWDALEHIADGYSNYHNYAKYDGQGYLESSSHPEEWVEKDDIVDYIIENDDDLGDRDIRDILDECEEEEENEDDDEEENEE